MQLGAVRNAARTSMGHYAMRGSTMGERGLKIVAKVLWPSNGALREHGPNPCRAVPLADAPA